MYPLTTANTLHTASHASHSGAVRREWRTILGPKSKPLYSEIALSRKAFAIGHMYMYRGADKSLARRGRKQANFSVKMALLTARVSMLKLRTSLTCFRACFRPGRAKDLSAPRYNFLLRMTDTMTSQLINICSCDTLYIDYLLHIALLHGPMFTHH